MNYTLFMRKIWFKKPATSWNEALPLGNGRLGAMVYGGINKEIIQLNEDSLWSNFYRDRNNRKALENLDSIRSLIDEKQIEEAQELTFKSLTGTPPHQCVYQTAGEVHLDFYTKDNRGIVGPLPNHTSLLDGELTRNNNYSRELCIDSAISKTQFTAHGITYYREYFISKPQDVIVMHFYADKPESIFFRANLDRGIFSERVWDERDSTIALEDTRGIPFCVMAQAIALSKTQTSSVKTCGACLTVEYADEAFLLVDIRTAYRCGKKNDSWTNTCRHHLQSLIPFSYDDVRKKHVADYQTLYNRLDFNLFPSIKNSDNTEMPIDTIFRDKDLLPSDERLSLFKEDINDPGLIELYYHFSRYLLISSSRKGTLPANLQGIWNEHMDPPWGSKYTININTQMNYWPACMTSLSECELPLFDLLEKAYEKGKITARLMYGCNGFVAHHNLDLWGDTAPQDMWLPGTYWLLGAAWLATHIREHYEYTFDLDFLERYYYLLHDACLFFSEFLIPKINEKTGKEYLVVSPSVSPENTYRLANGQTGSLCAGCEMDNRILEHLFSATMKSADELQPLSSTSISDADLHTFKTILSKIPDIQISKEGLIQEWNDEVEETEIGHRHMSHLYGLFPGTSISPYTTPSLAKAAEKTLERRLANGGGHTGWSRAWIINFRASLCQGNKALDDINKILIQSTLPNLFDNHPPFQIDGNFGTLAGITRMIIQSRLGSKSNSPMNSCVEIYLLPALPDAWAKGELRGVHIKGAISAHIIWEQGKLKKCNLTRENKELPTIQVKIFYHKKCITSTIENNSLEINEQSFL